MARVSTILTVAVLVTVLISAGNTQAQRSPVLDRPKLDRPKTDSPEIIIVPAGTKITVDISEENPPRNVQLRLHTGKVVNIVQVGSSVAIPALSKVTIQDSTQGMELTEVIIDGVRYQLHTDWVPLQQGSVSEATFTLRKDLKIKR